MMPPHTGPHLVAHIGQPCSRRSLLAGGLRLLAAGTLASACAPLTVTQAAAPAAAGTVRMGMVIDCARFADAALGQRVRQACHLAHNVPDTTGPQRIEWIWPEPFTRVFAEAMPHPPAWLLTAKVPVLCNHCDNPPCVRVCPTGSTFVTAEGRVGMDPHRCIGCRFCMAACPYGARSFNFCDPAPLLTTVNPAYPARMRGVVEKCTFCPERLAQGLAPACVEAADGAMICGDINDAQSAVRRLLDTWPCLQRTPELGTGPAVYYLIREG